MLTLDSGSGIWTPILWLFLFVLFSVIVLWLRGFGRSDYKKGTDQTMIFFSGNMEPLKDMVHIRSTNLYWGFTESLSVVFEKLRKAHTGRINDYVYWFVVVLALLFIIVILPGGGLQ